MKIGHRGAAGHAPENTIKSFEKAVELLAKKRKRGPVKYRKR